MSEDDTSKPMSNSGEPEEPKPEPEAANPDADPENGEEGAGEGGAPGERDAHYYASRPCARYVRETAELLAEYLQKQHYFS